MKQHSDDRTGQGAQAPPPFPAFLEHPYFRTVLESVTDAMALSDAEGIVLAANVAYLDLYGFPAEAVLGHSFAIIFPAAARQQAIQDYKSVFTSGDTEPNVTAYRQDAEGSPYFVTTIQRADGELRRVENRLKFVCEGGQRVAMLSIIRDVTALTRAEEALRTSEAQLAQELEDTKLLHALSCLFIEEENIESLYEPLLTAAVALMDADFGSIQMLDEEEQQLRLLAWKEFHPEAVVHWQIVACGAATVCGRAFRNRERLVISDVRTSELLVGSDSHHYYALSGIVAVQSTPLISRSGRLVGMISTHWREPHVPHERELQLFDVLARQAADVLERKQAEKALRETQESLKLALEAAHLGTWDLNLKTGKAHTNLRHTQIFGFTDPQTERPPDFFRQYILPEDLPKVDASTAEALESGESTLEFRVRRADGQVRWIYAQGRTYYDDAGRPMRMAGVTQDITERKQAEERLWASEERFRHYFELGLIGIAISSPTKGFVEVNDELCRILGYSRGELLQINWAEVTHPDDLASNIAQFNRVMIGEIDGYTLDKRCIRKDGQVIDTILSVKCIRGGDGTVDYFVALLQDITERKRAEENQAHLLRKVEEQRTLLRRLNRMLGYTQERERHELARNLHDLVGQNLTALNLNLKMIQTQLAAKLPTDKTVDARLDDARKLVEQVTVQVRDVMSDLRPPMLNDYGLLAALRWYASQVARRTDLTVRVEGDAVFPRLPEEMELNLFRIAQEALNNVAKHAQATHVTVSLTAEGQGIRLTIADNGRGMVVADPADSDPLQGWGMLIMREQAVVIGGHFRSYSEPGEGTTITVEVDR